MATFILLTNHQPPVKLVFATHNPHKLAEVQQLLPNTIQLLSLNDIGHTTEILETGKTLEENAKLKADFVTQTYNLNCFSDDSGLLVEALNGNPGVYSARYAGLHKSDTDNLAKVLAEMQGTTHRNAHFKTVIHLNINNQAYIFQGSIQGTLTHEPQGNQGFGYDPIFKPLGYDKTFAQLTAATKNAISHRAKAVQQLLHFLKNNLPF